MKQSLLKILKVLGWTIVGVLLLFVGAMQVLYTEWFQNDLRVSLVNRVNADQNKKMTLDKLEINFPLELTLEGLSIVENQNDTLIAAKSLVADVRLLPLIGGNVELENASIIDGRYRIGDIDSAMCMKIALSKASFDDTQIALSENIIDLSKGEVNGGRVDLIIKNDTMPSPPDTTESTPWLIRAKDLHFTNFSYHMSLESTIDSLGTHFVDANVNDLEVDLEKQLVRVGKVTGTELNAAYIASMDEAVEEEEEEESIPWTIEVGLIDFTNSKALYADAGATPNLGINYSYLQADNVDLKIASFYNQSSEISIPIQWFKGRERCGVELEGKGVFAIEKGVMKLQDFDLQTPYTQLKFEGKLGLEDEIQNASMALLGKGTIGIADIAKMYPLYIPLENGMLPQDKLIVDVEVLGAVNDLTIRRFDVDIAGRANVDAKGYVANVTNFEKIQGALEVSGEILDAEFVNALAMNSANNSLVLPKMTIDGKVNMTPGLIDGDIEVHTQKGELAMTAKWNSHIEGYDVNVAMSQFPIDAFLPRMGVGNVSGKLTAKGKHFNPFGANMGADVHLAIDDIDYNGVTYSDVVLDALLDKNNAEMVLGSANRGADLDLMACCTFEKSMLKWDVNADVRNLDFKALGLTEQRSRLAAVLNSKGGIDVETRRVRGALQIDEMNWRSDSLNLAVKDINTKIYATDSVINVALRNKDMFAFMSMAEPIDSVMAKVSTLGDMVAHQIDARRIDVEQIQQSLPRFNLNVRAGSQNLLSEYLATTNQHFDRLTLKASNDSLMNVSAQVLKYSMGTIVVDTINFEAHQYDKILMYNASIGNRPGTLDDYARVAIDGYVIDDLVSAHVQQQNIKGESGYNIGALAQLGDSIVRFEMFPKIPMIAYKEWEINDDNFIEYNMFTHHVDADVAMTNATSSINIYTEHNDSLHGEQEDVVVKINDLKLAELVAYSPYAPHIKGNLSADMRVNWGDNQLNGKGLLSLDEFVVGKERVGSFVADLGVTTGKSGALNANATLMVDGEKTLAIKGCLNDSTSQSPFVLDMSVIHFPLKVLNPVIPKNVGSLAGTLNGEMKISGSKSFPIINGDLKFDSAAVNVAMTGSVLEFDDVNIPIVDNVVMFNDFAVTGVNKNPLNVNGKVDIHDLSSPQIDLALEARNMQIIGSNKSKRTDVYGKGFIDVDAKIKGSLTQLNVGASINLLSGSNVTYIIPDATSAITSYSTEGMVKFVSFSDTVKVVTEEQPIDAFNLNLDVALKVSEGSTINVDLSADGKNRVQLQGNGTLNYKQNSMNDSRLTGRYTINKGFVRYTPPLMSEKLFNFVEGSYVAFNGDMMNPILNISAIDKVKANVTQEGHDSRLVNFDVKVAVTNTLENMNVAFDLSTPDDITIANELSTMSAEQRASQAMNMLLYNVYTGMGTKGNTNLSGNALYAFVESRLNSWAANNIGFVDVSFGIDQYDKTLDGTTSKTTSYSYKVSKTLFNDRFKIVVGGNYSTDADADENYSQNLINDISFEYMLNRSGTMYVKLFRQVGYESVLEGEVTQTGVGFVYKRKLKSLRDLFKKTTK